MQGGSVTVAARRVQVAEALVGGGEGEQDPEAVGLRLVESLVEEQKARGQGTLPGAEIFRLYDTYGFPVDLRTPWSATPRPSPPSSPRPTPTCRKTPW